MSQSDARCLTSVTSSDGTRLKYGGPDRCRPSQPPAQRLKNGLIQAKGKRLGIGIGRSYITPNQDTHEGIHYKYRVANAERHVTTATGTAERRPNTAKNGTLKIISQNPSRKRRCGGGFRPPQLCCLFPVQKIPNLCRDGDR